MSKQIAHESQLSFSGFETQEVTRTPARAAKVSKKAKASTTPPNEHAESSLKALLEQAEIIGMALQEKYEANLEAHRIQSRVGISVDVEDIENLMAAISKANSVLNTKN